MNRPLVHDIQEYLDSEQIMYAIYGDGDSLLMVMNGKNNNHTIAISTDEDDRYIRLCIEYGFKSSPKKHRQILEFINQANQDMRAGTCVCTPSEDIRYLHGLWVGDTPLEYPMLDHLFRYSMYCADRLAPGFCEIIYKGASSDKAMKVANRIALEHSNPIGDNKMDMDTLIKQINELSGEGRSDDPSEDILVLAEYDEMQSLLDESDKTTIDSQPAEGPDGPYQELPKPARG
ncbi:MAG: YbjN domain-containing protein, partial [bacterium]